MDDLSGTVVWRSVTETTSTISLLSDNGAGALASGERTTIGSAFRVGSTDTGDELGARRLSGAIVRSDAWSWCGGSWGSCGWWRSSAIYDTRSGECVGALDNLSGAVVWSWFAETAATIALLGDDGASTLSSVEPTAVRGAVCVPRAHAGNELGALLWRTGKDGCACEQCDVCDEENAENSEAGHWEDRRVI